MKNADFSKHCDPGRMAEQQAPARDQAQGNIKINFFEVPLFVSHQKARWPGLLMLSGPVARIGFSFNPSSRFFSDLLK